MIEGPRGLAYSSWGARFWAWLVDILVAFAIFITLGLVVALVIRALEGPTPPGYDLGAGVGALLGVILVPLYPAYLAMWHGGARGQTPGKRVAGIAVRDASSLGRVSYGRAFARSYVTMLFWLLYMIPAIIDGLWPLWDSRHQAIHDKIGKTVVIIR